MPHQLLHDWILFGKAAASVFQQKSNYTSNLHPFFLCWVGVGLSYWRLNGGFRHLNANAVENSAQIIVRNKVILCWGHWEPLLYVIKRQKPRWFGRVPYHETHSKVNLQETVEYKFRKGRQKKSWTYNMKQWKGSSFSTLKSDAEDRKR